MPGCERCPSIAEQVECRLESAAHVWRESLNAIDERGRERLAARRVLECMRRHALGSGPERGLTYRGKPFRANRHATQITRGARRVHPNPREVLCRRR